MTKNIMSWNSFRNAACAGGIAWLMTGSMGLAQAVRVVGDTVRIPGPSAPAAPQSARVAGDSIKYHPDVENKALSVEFRLLDNLSVTAVQVAADASGEAVPAKWNAWEMNKAPACAWLIVVDISSSHGPKTVIQYVDFVRSFLTCLPKQDQMAVYTLAGALTEVVPFGSTPEETATGLKTIKRADGTKSTTLIFSSLRDGLGRLTDCKQPRKVVLLLTNGRDQTEGGPEVLEDERKKLTDAANRDGIVVHVLGCADSADGKKYLPPLREIAVQTDGLYEAPSFGGEELPFGTMFRLRGVMHGAGVVRIDLSKLAKPEDLIVTVKTVTGRAAVVPVLADRVAEALGAAPSGAAAQEAETARLAQEAARKAEAEAIKAEADRLAEVAAAKKETAKAAAAEAAAEPVPVVADTTEGVVPAQSMPPPRPRISIWLLVLAGAGLFIVAVVVALLVWVLRKRGQP